MKQFDSIIVRISSGLGNQLFQYATARAIALRGGLPLRLDLTQYTERSFRPYSLGSYDITALPASNTELRSVFSPLYRSPRAQNAIFALNKLLPFRLRWIIHEYYQTFNSRLLDIRRGVYLSGFWQCNRYFRDVDSQIRRDLTLSGPIPPQYTRIVDQINASESVGLVVRRREYLEIPNTQGICTMAYYRNSVEHILGHVPDARVFVFSDDIQWCEANLHWISRVTFVENLTPSNPEEHLRILTLCRHFIVANSTFAWWGAWLSSHSNKLVVAPSHWMRDWRQYADVVPVDWIRVSSDGKVLP